ncbi:MAG: hypothetical protein OK436_06535 [Thaumarchaeota archaeon]|nr:hypothetical protein [Nitrososphaerota archaeon]
MAWDFTQRVQSPEYRSLGTGGGHGEEERLERDTDPRRRNAEGVGQLAKGRLQDGGHRGRETPFATSLRVNMLVAC